MFDMDLSAEQSYAVLQGYACVECILRAKSQPNAWRTMGLAERACSWHTWRRLPVHIQGRNTGYKSCGYHQHVP